MERGPRLNIDVLAGLLFVALGAAFLLLSVQLPAGPPRRLGPGSFPSLIASLMIGVGAIVTLTGLMRRDGTGLSLAWGKLFLLSAALGAFALLLRGAGLIIATIVLVAIASRAHPELDWKRTGLLGVGLGIGAAVLFTVLLRLPVPAVGPWIPFGLGS